MLLSKKQKYLNKIRNPFLYYLFMFWRLPSLVFWGVSLVRLEDDKCITSIKQKWTNQNPFHSIYFSALNGAAELSTGLLFQLHLQELESYSMLVVNSSADFKKKARGRIQFTCVDGLDIATRIQDMTQPNDNFTLTVSSSATNEQGEEVGRFEFTWSVKRIK